MVVGEVRLELKHVTVRIEYKWFPGDNQLNLREIHVSYRSKDPLERRRHTGDHLRDPPKELILRRIQESKLCGAFMKKPRVIWWEST
jgi:hypothetical protein